DDFLQTAGEAIARPARDHRRVGALELEQRMISGGARERIGRERATDVGALAALATDAGGEAHDDVAASADPARHRISPGDAFAENGQIGAHAKVALRAAQAEAEAGHHLVEDEEGAELVAQLTDLTVVIEMDRPRSALGADGLDQDRGGAAAQPI